MEAVSKGAASFFGAVCPACKNTNTMTNKLQQ